MSVDWCILGGVMMHSCTVFMNGLCTLPSDIVLP